MSSDDWRSKAAALATDIMERFLVPRLKEEYLPNFDGLKASLPTQYSELAAAFEKNVSAVVDTVGVPVTLATAAAERGHWQRIHGAERIRALGLHAEPGENDTTLEARRSDHALKIASEKMRTFVTSAEERDKIAADACVFLLDSLQSSSLSAAASELILQGAVLTWSALEILSRDLFETILNSDPRRALTIMQESSAKQRLPSRFTLEELASFDFDLSSSIGSLLSSQQDFSDIRTIKAAVLPALNSDPAVSTALSDNRLWVLCQQRHLILHRRGLIDPRYVEAASDQTLIGTRLLLKPVDLESRIDAVAVAGSAMLAAAARHTA